MKTTKKVIKHKRVGGNGMWGTLCGRMPWGTTWVNTWPAVTCPRCIKKKGSFFDYLDNRSRH